MAADISYPLTEEEIGLLHSAGVRLDERKVMLLEHPDLFIAHYFRHKLEALKEFHLRLIHAYAGHTKSLTLYPAFHGKTTLDSTSMPVWEVCRNPNVRLGIILKNETDASGVMRAIQAEMEDNRELIDDFGPFKPVDKGSSKPWALGRLEVQHRTMRSPRPTIQVYGAGGNVFGHRVDRVICDDVVTDKNSSTAEQRAKTREWFNLGVRTMPETVHDSITVVGTRFHPEDLYGDLMEMRNPYTDEPVWHVQWEDAIVDDEAELTLWPERWSYRDLMALRAELGTLDFNKRLRNIAVDPERMVFREEFVKGGWIGTEKYPGCLDREFRAGDRAHVDMVYGGFDPAMGVAKGSSFCVHTALGVGSCERHERCFWVIDQERDTMSLPRQADTILKLHGEHELLATKIEANAYQHGLNQLIEERMSQRGLSYRIEPHFTGSNKVDPEIGVQAMSPIIERGELHIPWADAYSRRRMDHLVRELCEYPGKRTDTVMSLWIAWLCAKDMAPRYLSFSRMNKPMQVGMRTVKFGRKYVQNPYYADIVGSGH